MTVYTQGLTLASGFSLVSGTKILSLNGSSRDRVTHEDASYESAVSSDGATGYWPFDTGENSTDANRETGNDAVATDSRHYEADGPPNSGSHGAPYGESANNDREFSIADYAGIDIDWDTDFTIEWWSRFNQNSASPGFIFSKRSATNGVDCKFNYSTNNLELVWYGSANRLQNFNGVVAANTDGPQGWHHYMLVYNADPVLHSLANNKLYIDGVDVGNQSNTGNLGSDFNNNDPLVFGGTGQSVNDSFRGAWKDLAFYNGTALTATEALAHYQRKIRTLGAGTYTGLISWVYSPPGGTYPFGAQIRELLIPGWLGRLADGGGEELHITFTLNNGVEGWTVPPNTRLENRSVAAGNTITLQAQFYFNEGFDSQIAAHIEEMANGFGPTLILDSQLDPVTGSDSVRFVVNS